MTCTVQWRIPAELGVNAEACGVTSTTQCTQSTAGAEAAGRIDIRSTYPDSRLLCISMKRKRPIYVCKLSDE